MSTEFFNDQWRIPSNENQNKVSNYSMEFDGSGNDFVDIGSQTFNPDHSLSFWINSVVSGPNSYGGILAGGANSISIDQGGGIIGVGKFYFRISSVNYTVSSTALVDETWNHVALTRSGTNVKFYINGVLDKTSTVPAYSTWQYIGTQTAAGNNPFNGKLDQVTIFDYELSQAQVTTLGNSGSVVNPMALSPAPVSYYQLGDQSVSTGATANYLVPNNSLKDYVFETSPSGAKRFNIPSLPIASAATISIWCNPQTLSNGTLFGDASTGLLRLTTQNATPDPLVKIVYCDGGCSVLTTNIAVSTFLNKWHHIALVQNGGVARVYIDNVDKGDVSGDLKTPSFTNIGAMNNGSTVFDGFVSNAATFTTNLPATGTESIASLYNNGSPPADISSYSGLQRWYKLNAQDTFNGTDWTIKDYAGSSNGTSVYMTSVNLVQSDLQHTSGFSPYALDFDGAFDWITVPSFMSNLPSNNIYSISTWVKTRVDTACIWGSSSTSNLLYAFVTDGTKLRIQRGSVSPIDISNLLIVGEWANLVAVFDSSTNLKIYINNVFIQNVTVGSLGVVNDDFKIGGGLNAYPLDCLQSNVSIWNAALTSAQVSEIYNQGVPSNLNSHSAYSNLISWWQLGSNSSFNTNWTVLNEISTKPNGVSQDMTEVDIVNGPGYTANGLGTRSIEIKGDAPYSSANSLSENMDVLDRIKDTPPTV